MNAKRVFVILAFFTFSLAWQTKDALAAEQRQVKLRVVATTSLIGSIVEEIGGEKVSVVTIVPAGMCPGHFDIRPGDVKVLEEAKVLLEHGFEGELFVENMLKLVENPEMLRVTLNVKGNWMVPKVHIQAIDKIVENLSRFKPEDGELFKSRAKKYKHRITQAGKEIQRKAKELGVEKIKVVCSRMQEEFVDWFGFKIVSTYGRPEDFTPNELKRIIKKAKEGDAKLVIDNLQSGSKAGVPIAEEIGALRIILTNFPQDFGGEISYLNSLKENASKLFEAIKE